jgi:hypothetical protein
MKNQKRNISMISNSESQIKTAADACGVHKWQVMKAKEDLNTNDRKTIYDHLKGVKSLEAAVAERDQNKQAPANPILGIRQALDIQKQSGNFDSSPYMLGMANGLIFALACIDNVEPNYLKAPVDGFLEDKKVQS